MRLVMLADKSERLMLHKAFNKMRVYHFDSKPLKVSGLIRYMERAQLQ
jgi:hypothetical protein